jgi:hypothetical protein
METGAIMAVTAHSGATGDTESIAETLASIVQMRIHDALVFISPFDDDVVIVHTYGSKVGNNSAILYRNSGA